MIEKIGPTDDVDWHVGYASTLELVWNHSIFEELGVPLLMAVEDTVEVDVVLMMKMMMCRLPLSSPTTENNSDRMSIRVELRVYCCRRPHLHRCHGRDHSFALSHQSKPSTSFNSIKL
jgi:hypothetical protein